MKRLLKWSGITLAAVLIIATVGAGGFYASAMSRLGHQYEITPETIVIPTDSATIERGRHLASAVTLCHACHGDDLGGHLIFEAPGIATLYAPNITTGRGGLPPDFTTTDFVRAIRHGVKQDGRGLMIMHSDAFNHLGREDLAAIIAYLQSRPPVDNEVPARKTEPLGRVFMGLGMFDGAMPLIPAEVIDHDAPIPERPAIAVTPEYGHYLMTIAVCTVCHGTDLLGGPPVDEGAPPTPAIAQWGRVWSDEQFIQMIRTGVTPYGKQLNATVEVMPLRIYANMTDDELAAIWRYVGTMVVQ